MTAPEMDLRGSPKGEVERWTSKRGREQVEVLYCAAGWHSTNGGPHTPYGDALCSTVLARGRDAYREFHERNPVQWQVRTRRGRTLGRAWYCSADLPDEYLDLTLDQCHPSVTEGGDHGSRT